MKMARSAPVTNGSLRGMVFDIQRFAIHDGPGISNNGFPERLRATVCMVSESRISRAEI